MRKKHAAILEAIQKATDRGKVLLSNGNVDYEYVPLNATKTAAAQLGGKVYAWFAYDVSGRGKWSGGRVSPYGLFQSLSQTLGQKIAHEVVAAAWEAVSNQTATPKQQEIVEVRSYSLLLFYFDISRLLIQQR